MSDLTIINHENQRVLTTNQLAESYGASSDYVNRNFSNNKERYKHGKHYFLLEGEDLKDFKMTTGKNDGSLLRVNKLYLWTEKGAWLHAKSLNTDQAWDAYEMLVDDYYNVKVQQEPQSLEVALRAALEHEKEIKTIKSDVTLLKGTMRITSLQQQEIQVEVRKVVVKALGGKESPAYAELKGKLFSDFWKEFKHYFKVPRYGDLPTAKFDEAINYLKLWRPSTSMQMEIDSYNSQMAIY